MLVIKDYTSRVKRKAWDKSFHLDTKKEYNGTEQGFAAPRGTYRHADLK
jgi:hypothetical protein